MEFAKHGNPPEFYRNNITGTPYRPIHPVLFCFNYSLILARFGKLHRVEKGVSDKYLRYKLRYVIFLLLTILR